MAAYDFNVVEPLVAPESAIPGDQVWFEGYMGSNETYTTTLETLKTSLQIPVIVNIHDTVVWNSIPLVWNEIEIKTKFVNNAKAHIIFIGL